MGTSAESGIGDRSFTKLEQLDRGVVVAATITSVVFAALMVSIGSASGSTEVLQRAIAPGVVATIGILQLYWRRPNAVAQLAAGAVAVVLHASVLGPDPTALLGVLAMAITGVLFVRRRISLYAVAVAALLYLLGTWWA